jgi:cell division septation protein DedD
MPFEAPRRTHRPERYIHRVGRRIARGAIAATLALVALNAVVAAAAYMPRPWTALDSVELPPLPARPELRFGREAERTPAAVETSRARPTPARAAVARPTDGPNLASAGGFAVAVGAFRTKARAASLAGELTQSGFTSFTREATSRTGVLQQVFVGPFQTQSAAEQELARLRTNGNYADARVVAVNAPTPGSHTPDGTER